MSITSDLTQALQCAGKCDCCQKLQNQINALEAKFNNYALKSSLDNYLLKNEKPTIINEAYYKMEGYVTPKFALVDNELDGLTIVLQGLVITIAAIKATIEGLGTQIANFITWVRLEISKLWDWISSQIKKLEAKNYDSEIAELRRLINEANNNAASAKTEVKEIRPISEKAYELAQSVNNELLKFKDSVRSALEGLRTELKKDIDYVTERALAAMQRLQTRIENVEPVAKQGLDLAGTANNKAIDAKSKADRGYSLAESAKFKAEESLGRADAAYAEATEAIGKANNANNRAIDAKSKAEEALGRADAAYQEVTDIKPKLSAVETRVTDTNRRIDGLDVKFLVLKAGWELLSLISQILKEELILLRVKFLLKYQLK
jgi:predicted  nucleic acid-binding Zn-ribbon protein